jgi:GxxExxY protein
MNNLNELTDAIIGAAMEVHRTLGAGLLESTYEMCLCRKLSIRGIPFERQVPISVEYKGVKLDCGYRADIVIDRTILVEIKAIDSLLPIHDARLLSLPEARRLENWTPNQLQRGAVEKRTATTRARLGRRSNPMILLCDLCVLCGE